MKEYDFSKIELHWQQQWKKDKIYEVANESAKPKCYVLDMFPYPSGAGLHVGHPLGYIATDIYARYKRLTGFHVLHPMGYDSFGLPAEQYAIQTGQHPAVTTQKNINRYREQLEKIGFGYDWSREIRTSDPSYYRWTQWIFIQLFQSWYNHTTQKAEPIETLIKQFEASGFSSDNNNVLTGGTEFELSSFTAGEWKQMTSKQKEQVLTAFRLAYLSDAYVNWCPALGTVLSNDEVKDGVSERGGFPVERKLMKQWSMRITAYADRLLNDLDALQWSDSMKEAQRNWIGKSTGCSITFHIQDTDLTLEVFTTRPDTIFGVSFVTLAPEHELIKAITQPEYADDVMKYVQQATNRSERERQADVKKITGVFTGAYIVHPFTGKEVPIWVADYVLSGYGTGAVMGVPAHDSRDFAFANQFHLPILPVVKIPEGHDLNTASYDAKEGVITHSDFLNGLSVYDAIKKAIAEIENKGIGKSKTNYRLRDAIFGRQRYWGEPIPVYYKDGVPHAIPTNALPLQLPEIDTFLPTEDGEPPLARAKEWKWNEATQKPDKEGYDIETTTMPGWAGSSWYFLRYMDPHNTNELVSKEAAAYWKNVDVYLGGSEHATGHLLYVRFWTKFLYDRGWINVQEPAQKLINQGMIQGLSAKNSIFVRGFKNDKGELVQAGSDPLFIKGSILTSETVINVIYSSDFFNGEEDDSVQKYHSVIRNYNIPIELIDVDSSILIEKFYDSDFAKNNFHDLILANKFGYWRKIYNKVEFRVYDKLSLEQGVKSDDSMIRKVYVNREVEKMSKSKYNVVTPDDIITEYGADTLRLYEMFLGPLEQSKPWSTQGIEGVHRFLKKLWRLFYDANGQALWNDENPQPAEWKALHKLIKKTADDIESFSFNTTVSSFMICVNELTDLGCHKKEILHSLLICISPYAPHIAEELWHALGNKTSVVDASFPVFNPAYLVENSFNYPISINGKHRTNMEFSLSAPQDEITAIVLKDETVLRWMEGKSARKVVFVKGKIINIVV